MKYLLLYQKLKQAIGTGFYPTGKRIPHTHELVKKYSVSLTTVTRAVTLLQDEGLIRRVKSKGSFVLKQKSDDYIAYHRRERIGLLIDGKISKFMDMHFFRQIFEGMERIAQKQGKSIVIIPREDKPVEEYLAEIHSNSVAGVIPYSFYNQLLYNGLKKSGLALVYCDFLDHILPVDQVTVDHARAGALAFNRLFELGHKKMLFFGTYIGEGKREDTDHFYWWQGIESQARFQKLKHVFRSFFFMDNTLKERIRTAVDTHADCTGYICASSTYLEHVKDIIENDRKYHGKTRDAVLFGDVKEGLFLRDRCVSLCRWDTRNMGGRAMEAMLEILEKKPRRPGIQYVPVEIV